MSFLTPIHFRVTSLIFGPLLAKYLAENGVSRTFWKNYWLNSFHTNTFFVIRASFSVLWWPNIWLKMGFPELFETKTIGSINFIPGIYPCGVSLMPPLHFRDPSLIFGPLVATYLAENGLPEFKRNRNIYWIFLDEVGSDQSGGILSPFMDTACSYLEHDVNDLRVK